MFISQDSSEATERNLTQTSLGRKENGLIHVNGNPEVGLASGTQMASSGSSHSLLIYSVPVCALKRTSSCVWARGAGAEGEGGMAPGSSRVNHMIQG